MTKKEKIKLDNMRFFDLHSPPFYEGELVKGKPHGQGKLTFEKFDDSDLNGVWTQDLLEFRWEKVTWKDNWKEQVTPLSSKGVSEPWALEYEGNDQGRIAIRLTVVDHRSTNRNEKEVVLSQEEWNFKCTRVLEKAPRIDSEKVELTYNYNY